MTCFFEGRVGLSRGFDLEPDECPMLSKKYAIASMTASKISSMNDLSAFNDTFATSVWFHCEWIVDNSSLCRPFAPAPTAAPASEGQPNASSAMSVGVLAYY